MYYLLHRPIKRICRKQNRPDQTWTSLIWVNTVSIYIKIKIQSWRETCTLYMSQMTSASDFFQMHCFCSRRMFIYCQFGTFVRLLFCETSHMQSFVKTKSSRNGEITLSFTDIGESCHSRECLASQISLLMHIAKIAFSRKFPYLQYCTLSSLFPKSNINNTLPASGAILSSADSIYKQFGP